MPMESDLITRLREYSTTAAAQSPSDPRQHADALASSDAASAAASAAIICSHTRELRGDSPPADLLPGQDELDLLAADKPASGESLPFIPLPLRSGKITVDDLAAGADAIPAIKARNG
jgi:hypothetical protein